MARLESSNAPFMVIPLYNAVHGILHLMDPGHCIVGGRDQDSTIFGFW